MVKFCSVSTVRVRKSKCPSVSHSMSFYCCCSVTENPTNVHRLYIMHPSIVVEMCECYLLNCSMFGKVLTACAPHFALSGFVLSEIEDKGVFVQHVDLLIGYLFLGVDCRVPVFDENFLHKTSSMEL